MTTKCAGCGKFIPYAEMGAAGGARHEFEPLSEFGPERSEWICRDCVEEEYRDDNEATRQWLENGSGLA